MDVFNATFPSFRANHPAYNAVLITFSVILIFTVVLGNFLVIATFLKTNRLKRPTYYLLSSLAFVDFLTGAVVIPAETVKRVALIEVLCFYKYSRYLSALSYLCGGTSLLHLVMVTLDRYIAVHKPLRYETFVTSKRIFIGIALSCVICTVFATAVVAKPEDPNLIENYCAATNTETDRLSRLLFELVMATVMLSGIIMITLNVSILRTAIRHARRIAQMEQAVEGTNHTASLVKASQIMTAITFGFFICYIPTSVFYLVLGMAVAGRPYSRPFDDIATFTHFCSYAINPIIYCYRDRAFRENALRYFKDKAVWRNLCSAEATFVQT